MDKLMWSRYKAIICDILGLKDLMLGYARKNRLTILCSTQHVSIWCLERNNSS